MRTGAVGVASGFRLGGCAFMASGDLGEALVDLLHVHVVGVESAAVPLHAVLVVGMLWIAEGLEQSIEAGDTAAILRRAAVPTNN